jgi:hypothetical protein
LWFTVASGDDGVTLLLLLNTLRLERVKVACVLLLGGFLAVDKIFRLNYLIFLLVGGGCGAFTLLLPAGVAEASVLAAGCGAVCWLVVAACASRTAVLWMYGCCGYLLEKCKPKRLAGAF